MTPPDTREQARAAAHAICGVRGDGWCLWTSSDVHSSHCDAVTALLDARDAAHAAELQQAKNMHLERALERDAARAEVATLTAEVTSYRADMNRERENYRREVATLTGERDEARNVVILAHGVCKHKDAEVDTLRSRLSTAERERDEGRGLLREALDRLFQLVPAGQWTYVERLYNGGRAYLSRSPVEGGREMVTPSAPAAESPSAASVGERLDPWSMERHDRFPGSGPRDDSWRILARSDKLRWKQYETTARPPYVAVVFSEANARAIVTAHNALPASPETRDMKTREGT